MNKFRNVKTRTVYAYVDESTWDTGYVRVHTGRSVPYLVRTSNLEIVQPEYTVGKLPNKRAGFYHLHSGQTECGIAYWTDTNLAEGQWFPCTKLVNHEDKCGRADNSAF